MSEKKEYRTKQKEELLDYLKTVPDRHITVAQICEHFRAVHHNIGTTTVYRQLEKLVDEGLVNKYVIDSNSPACFEFIDRGHRCANELCFHCKCERCGRLIHLECDDLKDVMAHVLKEHGFQVDPRRTVYYGLCEECRG